MVATEAGGREAVTLPMLAELGLAARLWRRTMRSESKSGRTTKTYTESVIAFGRWLRSSDGRRRGRRQGRRGRPPPWPRHQQWYLAVGKEMPGLDVVGGEREWARPVTARAVKAR